MMTKLSNSSQKYIKAKGEDRQRSFYDQNYGKRIYENRYRSNSGDRRISFSGRIQYGQKTATDQGIIRTIEVILEEEILEGICSQISFIEVKIIEVDTEEIIETIIMTEVDIGLGIDSIAIILEQMIEVIVGLHQVPELVSIEIELDTIKVGNINLFLK